MARTPGSSPHTRGAHHIGRVGAASGGIIPAYAGSTEEETKDAGTKTDHPRIRGEHVEFSLEPVPGGGSSPHTRGAPENDNPGVLECRIIPAYAGSTLYEVYCYREIGDHPRIRGEHPHTCS